MVREKDVDSAVGPDALIQAWLASGRRFAVVIGSTVALLSLLGDTPVRIASFRGAIALGTVLALTNAGAWLLPRIEGARGDSEAEFDGEPEPDVESVPGSART